MNAASKQPCQELLASVVMEQMVEPLPTPADSNAAGWALLVIMVGIIAFELWAVATKRPTISQWVQRRTRGRSWWKVFGVGAIGLLLWHLFEGGPL